MLMLVLTWTGMVLGVTLLLLMALGPVIVELDSWLSQRKRDRRRTRTVVAADITPAREAKPAIVAHAA
ncbi:MAG: hypothetical protein ABW215_09785 [Kibdelosporangium sp.]